MSTQSPKYIVTPDAQAAGALVWWSLSGHFEVARLREQLLAAGWQEDDEALALAKPTTPGMAFRRAAMDLQERRTTVDTRTLVRPLKERQTYAIVTEVVGAGRAMGHQVATTAWAATDSDGRIVPFTEPVNDAIQAHLEARSTFHQANWEPGDAGYWLTSLANLLGGVPLRDRGGFYFIPAGPQLDRWKALTSCLEKASNHRVYSVPAMKTDDAVRAVLDAVAREAEDAAAKFEEELIDEKLGPRAWAGRVEECTNLAAKVQRYETLLDGDLSRLRDRLERLHGQLAVAALATNSAGGATAEAA